MEILVIIASALFAAMVLLFVVLTCVSCLQYNDKRASAAPATFDGLTSGPAPTRGGGSKGGSGTAPGEDSLEVGENGPGSPPTQTAGGTSGGRKKTVPVRYLSRRWLRSFTRRKSSEEERSPRPPPFLENDRLNRLPSYRFLFRAPPPPSPRQAPDDATAAAAEEKRPEPPAAQRTQDQGPKRSLSWYFSKSPSARGAGAGAGGSPAKKRDASKPIEEEEPRRRGGQVPQFSSRGSLASWHGAPPPEYVSMKAVERESTPPPARVSVQNVMSGESTPNPNPPAYVSVMNVLSNASSAEGGTSSVEPGDSAAAENSRHVGAGRQPSNQTTDTTTHSTPKLPKHAEGEGAFSPDDGQRSQLNSSAVSADEGRRPSVRFVHTSPEILGGDSGGESEEGITAFGEEPIARDGLFRKSWNRSSSSSVDDSTSIRRDPSIDSMICGPTPTDITMSLFSNAGETNWKDGLHNNSFKAGPAV